MKQQPMNLTKYGSSAFDVLADALLELTLQDSLDHRLLGLHPCGVFQRLVIDIEVLLHNRDHAELLTPFVPKLAHSFQLQQLNERDGFVHSYRDHLYCAETHMDDVALSILLLFQMIDLWYIVFW